MTTEKSKKRYWAMVLYPESSPADWLVKLQQTGLQCAVSPLHDRDTNPTGEPKKPHYHVILAYGGPTTYANVKSLTDSLNQPSPIPLDQIRGYYRYLTHMDNPEKAQYSPEDIHSVNGFNIADYTDLTRSEVNAIKLRMLEIIRKSDILEYSDFMDLLQDSDMNAEFDIASSNTLFFDRYISSRRNKRATKA